MKRNYIHPSELYSWAYKHRNVNNQKKESTEVINASFAYTKWILPFILWFCSNTHVLTYVRKKLQQIFASPEEKLLVH